MVTAEQTKMVRNITRIYRAASAEHTAAGTGWYGQAYAICVEIDPTNPEMVAGVIAALSPRAQWSVNLRWTKAVIAAAKNGEECPNVHTTAMRAQAWRIANGENALDVLNGQKVRSFYSNIVGDTNAVTVDVWATFVATGSKDAKQISTPTKYAVIVEAYRRAAKIIGVAPSTIQAVTWTAIRGFKPSDLDFHASASVAA
jgi:hypothetical protein